MGPKVILGHIFFATIFFQCEAAGVLFKECPIRPNFRVSEVDVNPCKAPKTVCTLTKGFHYEITVKFVPTARVESLKAVVHGRVFGVMAPFILNNSNACVDSNLTCPLQAGQEYVYKTTVFVEPFYPTLELVLIRWTLQANRENSTTVGSNGEEVSDEDRPKDVCFLIKAEIAQPKVKRPATA